MVMRKWGHWSLVVGALSGCGGNSEKSESLQSNTNGSNTSSEATSVGGSAGEGTGGEVSGGQATFGSGGSGGQGSDVGSGGTGASSSGGFGADTTGSAGSGGSGGSQVNVCPFGSFDTDANDSELTCQPWTACKPGERLASQGTLTRDTECVPCPSGQFSDHMSTRICEPWRRCTMAEQELAAPSNTQDRECGPSELFPPVPGWARAVYIGSNGPRLLVSLDVVYASETSLWSYPFAGGKPEQLILSTGRTAAGAGEEVPRAVGVGDDVVLVVASEQNSGEASFVRRVSASGSVVWQQQLGSASDYFANADIIVRDDTVYVLAQYYPTDAASPLFALYTGSLATGTFTSLPLQGDWDGGLNEFELASNGHLYVAGIGPLGSYTAWSMLAEFDSTGSAVTQQDLGPNFLEGLLVDDAGGVYAMADPGYYAEAPSLFHIASGGEQLDSAVIEVGAQQFIRSPTGFTLIGSRDEQPLLVHMDVDFEVVSSETLDDLVAPYFFAEPARADDGTLYVGGSINDQAFVRPWPQ